MKITKLLVIISLLGILICCKKDKVEDQTKTEQSTVSDDQKREAVANMASKSGSKVEGTVKFMPLNDGKIMYSVALTGLESNSSHAIHIHENGDCSSDDGTSAGGHWNPTGGDHGHLGHSDSFHLGDIGNLRTNENGIATLTGTTDKWSMTTGEENNIIGKAIIVHAKEDDFKTQPTGGAGIRIACGVIE